MTDNQNKFREGVKSIMGELMYGKAQDYFWDDEDGIAVNDILSLVASCLPEERKNPHFDGESYIYGDANDAFNQAIQEMKDSMGLSTIPDYI